MGWKAIRDHYRISHHVQVNSQGICIGSGYIPDIIVISMDGRILKRYDERSSADLLRYQAEIDADPGKLKELILVQDTFNESITVFTYKDGEIIEKLCEKLGWPNVTHDGCMMYENSYSSDKSQVVRWAKKNATAGIEIYSQFVIDAEKRLKEVKEILSQQELNKKALDSSYPD